MSVHTPAEAQTWYTERIIKMLPALPLEYLELVHRFIRGLSGAQSAPHSRKEK